jgi:hypothetical protein
VRLIVGQAAPDAAEMVRLETNIDNMIFVLRAS